MSSTVEPVIKPVKVISASAGTGKTARLSQEYIQGSRQLTADSACGIIATTFTNKAADELVERIRRRLLKEEDWLAAQAVLSGYLGTVNSICGRLVSEHAIDAGLSPDFTIISEERSQAVFGVAVDAVIHQFADELHDPAKRLQIEDWHAVVHEIIDFARNNDLKSESLEECAQHSWERLEALFPPIGANDTAGSIDTGLAQAVEGALRDLSLVEENAANTRDAIEYLSEVNRYLQAGHFLIWQTWAKLAKLDAGAPFRKALRPLHEAAGKHACHPRLRSDLQTVIFGVFRCAREAMREYASFKRTHGLIDFVDQEHLALRILRQPEVQQSFKEKVSILLVDEFQDTSPIQLAVFLEISRLVNYSVWVGDEKQSIFKFRGSDPELMKQSVKEVVALSSGSTDRLNQSFRSRPSLVRFANELFSRCASRMDISRESAVIEEVYRSELQGQNFPLHVWWLDGRREQSQHALANSVAEVLEKADDWLVVDRQSKELRPIRGSDIAILCRWNSSRLSLAKALAAHGLTVATERGQLLDTPECVLALAALRLLVDDSDTLAVAEIANMLLSERADAWLNTWLAGGREAVVEELPAVKRLLSARHELTDRTPSQALELAIAYGGVVETAISWGNPRQRLANLDALRGLAKKYEEVCSSSRWPATTAGLLVYLHKGTAGGGNQPANPDENGIHVLTYHKAKGLEWPMVIMFDLDSVERDSTFGITVESTGETLDPMRPLAGRSLRYWPWPYGNQRFNVPLLTAVGKSKEARVARRQAAAESLRLMYVGMTRARDYLILSRRPSWTQSTIWLDTLLDAEGEKILYLPLREEATMEQIIADVPASTARIEIKRMAEVPISYQQEESAVYMSGARADAPIFHPPYHLRPSAAKEADFAVIDGLPPEVMRLGDRLALSGVCDMQVIGDCVHAYFAVDDPTLDAEMRSRLAASVLHNWRVANLSAADLVEAGTRLHQFIATTYPDGVVHRELPVSGRVGLRRVNGSIDMLLELPSGLVVLDHKTFPGRFDEWVNKALSHKAQLALYGRLAQDACGKEVIATYIHMPIAGAMIKVDCRFS
ncbi:MAG TPA: UvrD-helicase domain-containing protein [Planktothrix sp.]|jgi:ATP-dependent exoDNAse (exonuclease V) beta subunit